MSTVEVHGRKVIGGVLVEAEDGQRLDVIEPATPAERSAYLLTLADVNRAARR